MEYASAVSYQHTQSYPQWLMGLLHLFAIAMFSVAAFVFRDAATSPWMGVAIIAWASVIYLAILNFSRLTVTVTAGAVHLRWRLGWPTKTIQRSDIRTTTPHRNSWWVGFGIRKVTRGWMWNVWGLDAVTLELDGGRAFRIGTDDIDGLLAALSS